LAALRGTIPRLSMSVSRAESALGA
jgi:hypothetical protein